MKRTFLIVSALSLIGLMLLSSLACAEETPPFKGIEITIPVLAGPSGEAVKKLAPQFEAISGMKVNIEILSHDELWKKMELDAAAKSGNFDAFHINYFKLDEYRNSGAIIALDDFIKGDVSPYSDPKWDDFAFALLKAMSERDGKYYAFPHMGDTRLLWYNKELFAKAGLQNPPDTWVEFTDYARKMTTPDGKQYGAGFEWQKSIYVLDMFQGLLLENGSPFFDENWNSQMNSPAGQASLQFMYDTLNKEKIVPPDVINWGHTELTNGIVTGYVAMADQWHVFIPQAEDPSSSLVAGKLGYALVPGIKQADGTILRRDSLGTWGFAINSASKNPKATYAFLEWLKSPEIDVQYALMGGTSTRVSTNNDPRVIEKFSFAPVAAKSLSEVVMPLPIIPNFTEWVEAAGTEIHKGLVNQLSVKEALDGATDISNKLMEKIGFRKVK
ncbi:MAG: sugar ABC transporter substrate-binding protein [Candidatus Atribacteria bacterium]|nr:sugar ABC transporter substrate-binding protein [Candidatus Atribacteria bacterium]